MTEDIEAPTTEPGRRGLRGLLVGALAVALLGAGALAVRASGDDDGDDRTDVAADDVDGSGPPWPTVPKGKQAISFHGIEVLFPSEWQFNDARCGTPQGDTVMLPIGGFDACLVPEPPGLTVVEVLSLNQDHGRMAAEVADREVLLDGGTGRRGAGEEGAPGHRYPVSVLALPDQELVVVVRGPDAALRDELLDDVRITPIDSNGCPDRVTTLDPPDPSGRADAARLTVPGTPTSATLCTYEGLRLASSAPPLAGTELDELVSLLNDLPEGVSQPGAGWAVGCDVAPGLCEAERERGFVATFRYAEGPRVVAHVRIGGVAPLAVDTGDRTTKLSTELLQVLMRDVAYYGSFPDPREFR